MNDKIKKIREMYMKKMEKYKLSLNFLDKNQFLKNMNEYKDQWFVQVRMSFGEMPVSSANALRPAGFEHFSNRMASVVMPAFVNFSA